MHRQLSRVRSATVAAFTAAALTFAPGCGSTEDATDPVDEVTDQARDDAGEVTSCADLAAAWVAVSEGLAIVDTEVAREIVNGFRLAGNALDPVRPPEGITGEWNEFRGYIDSVNHAFGPVDPGNFEAVQDAFNSVGGAEDAATNAEAITGFLNADCPADAEE